MCLFLRCENLEHPLAKIRQVIRLAAGNEMSVNDDSLVFPNCACVDQVVLNSWRTCHFDALVYAGRDGNPAAMTNGRDKFASVVKPIFDTSLTELLF